MVDPLDTKKTTPGQDSHRRQWILDVVRANQLEVADILTFLVEWDDIGVARGILNDLHKNDRDAILQPNGILTLEQLKALDVNGDGKCNT